MVAARCVFPRPVLPCKSVSATAQKRIETKLRDYVYPILRENPSFGPNIRHLKNWDPPTWRYRVGDWRFFYEIDERQPIVFMTAADHRKEAYRWRIRQMFGCWGSCGLFPYQPVPCPDVLVFHVLTR